MARKEAQTDLWVAEQLKELGIEVCPQGSAVPDIDTALKRASKKGTGKPGFPEFTAVIKDFVLVVEDKADAERLERLDANEAVDLSPAAIQDYAVNGALHYALCIAENSGFRKVFAVGVAGSAERHRIKALFADEDGLWKDLGELESFDCFGPDAIGGFYSRAVLGEPDPAEKTRVELLKDAAELHELLRTYGSVKDQDKPLIVAGILLALDEIEKGSFKPDDLTGDTLPDQRDGDKIMRALKARLLRSNVGPDAKREKLLAEFQIFKTSERLNEVNPKLHETPLHSYTLFIYKNIFHTLKKHEGREDFIGRFYGEFMSYSGGDGQTLGIVLTPAHICSLMCNLVKLKPKDVVIDPTCGTGGFLIEAMRRMLLDVGDDEEKKQDIKKKRIHGFELQSNMFAAAAVNMILHGDGQSNIACCDFLKQDPEKTREERKPTVGLMNPPYSQGTKSDPGQYELAFAEKLLDSLEDGGRAAIIVPQSSMTGKTKEERALKRSILKKHTLEGVITCNPDTFYGVGVQPVIAVFTAHEPHPKGHVSKFIDFRDDGWTVRPHKGLVKNSSAAEKKARLLAVWNGNVDAPSRFCVKAAVGPDDEWLHGAHWFNDEIPSEADFEKAVGDYLTFEFSMVMQNRGYLFESV